VTKSQMDMMRLRAMVGEMLGDDLDTSS